MENDVKKIRDELGLTQQQLADIMGVTNITICRWETEFVKISPARMRHLELLRGKTDLVERENES